MAAAITLTSCTPMTPAATGGSGGGGETPTAPAEPAAPTEPATPTEPTAPTPDPMPQETEKRWTLSAPHFRDDNGAIWAEMSNRSEPFAWDRITADNMDDVRVSIDGKELPFASTTYEPAFAPDLFGAEWKAEAQVSAGAVVLVLTAEDSPPPDDPGRVGSITITAPGSGYTSVPAVTIAAPPAGGVTATATAAGPGTVAWVNVTNGGFSCQSATVSFSGGGGSGAAGTPNIAPNGAVTGVTITNPGSGYTSAPSVTFSGCTGGAAVGTATLYSVVRSVTITNPGRGYTSAPAVTIAAPGGSGTTATATATLRRAPRGTSQAEHLYYARQTLYGKQLLVRITDDQ